MTAQKSQIVLDCEIERGDFSRGGEASSKLKGILQKLGIPTKAIRKISITTYELEMNIIIHSEGGNLKAKVDSEKIKIIAKDDGPGIEDIEQAFKPGYSTADESIRELGFGAGMGLCNIERYSDELNVTSELGVGTKIEVDIYFN